MKEGKEGGGVETDQKNRSNIQQKRHRSVQHQNHKPNPPNILDPKAGPFRTQSDNEIDQRTNRA